MTPDKSHHSTGRTESRCRFKTGNITTLSLPAFRDILTGIYSRDMWVYDHLLNLPDNRMLRGRIPVVAGKMNGIFVAVKRLHHGGRLSVVTGDRFLTKTRFVRHACISDYLSDRGIRSPEVLFVSWCRIKGFIRGEIGVEFIPGGMDAARFLFGKPGDPPVGWERCIRGIASVLNKLHSAGVSHPDLNLMNFFISGEGIVWLLDLDKVRIRPDPSPRRRDRMLSRLMRSIRKEGSNQPGEILDRIASLMEREVHAGATD